MESVELQEYLDVLPFPAFVLDCDHFPVEDETPSSESITPIAVNRACRDENLGTLVWTGIRENGELRKWLAKPYVDDLSSKRGQDFFEMPEIEFTFNFIRRRYKVITTRARRIPPPPPLPRPGPPSGRVPSWTLAWCRRTPQSDSELHRRHLEHLLAKDWSATPMGPLDEWPQSLRTMSSYVLNCPFPCAMFWGEEIAILYNQEYSVIAQDKHPHILGQPYAVAWSELWDEGVGIKERLLLGMSTGESTRKDNDALFLNRSNVPMEEVYIDWGLIPFPREPGGEEQITGTGGQYRVAEKGRVGGLVNPVFENTQRVLTERRLKLLREMGQKMAVARSTMEYWNIVLSALSEGELDVPGCVAYGKQPSGDDVLNVMGQIGLDYGHEFFPEKLHLNALPEHGFEGYLRRVLTGESIVIEDEVVLSSFEPRGWGDQLRRAVVVPITPSTTRPPQGVLFLVLSSRRPYDEDYALFIELLTRQIATSLANVQLLEEEIRRAHEIAEADRRKGEELERALALRTRELRASEGFMGRLAEICPVGIFVSDGAGIFSFVNDTWYKITSFPRSLNPSDWISHIHPDDVRPVSDAWETVLKGAPTINCEFRWIHPPDEGYESSDMMLTWCSMAVAPELDHEGNVIRVFGAISDISDRKRAESEQRQRLEEAVEHKRQQENFIDMVSHEMRNPLSAILQSSDTVLQCLTKVKRMTSPEALPPEINDALDAIHTVMLCSTHQKRIIDDTLTMSKLDSSLLLVTPVDTQPVKVVEQIMRMFENDFSHKGITPALVVHPSYNELQIDWLKADPSRFTQVLVNLLTNAIKFTAGRQRRLVTVTVGPISETRPAIESSTRISSPSISPPGERDILFLSFSVSDTGSGLSDDERALLFQKFTQASPVTHVNYGGSGLGLFICRKLTELQGGQIMVQSRQGEGSTFSFYIETRRSGPPTPLRIGNVDPLAVAAAGLTNSRTEGSFLKSEVWQGQKKALESLGVDQKASYNILIVEDNVINQQVLAKQLQLANCSSIIAKHGLEALQIISASSFSSTAGPDASSFDVCLMDIEMPVMNGLTACHRIRAMEQSGDIVRRIPVVAVTANARQEQVEHMIKEGFDEVLTKPFRVPQLLSVIQQLLERFVDQGAKEA